ncbi:uncharacterized protein P174DRAFT_446163 [Aspergillus novofumigatus IBT 16806]|uniref:Uncharacterized protein n=1 Tax=Aspergillus novofumigatus (strain IBT 16806) TaxID=1392255 RepID=A0A2I1BTD6_ASPN1|nr:uncharacterized protein P174DRAFT_446163 [Aspergillus novofumigatus IBT 16806]PKX88629.1 hypothetical protein P174DRAFT_446163 [Aspergillus novofumigatus IBT 16806]
MRLFPLIITLLAFIQGSHAFLFFWWIPLPIFVNNRGGGGGGSCNSCCDPCHETVAQFNQRNSACINTGSLGGAATGCQ